MDKRRLIYWVDAGMAVMAGVFIAIALSLPGEDYFIPVLLGYMVAVVVWAWLAESAVTRPERRNTAPVADHPEIQLNTPSKPVPH